MYMRPEIDDQTEEMIRKWLEENPDKGISGVGPAIDYLIPKAIDLKDRKQLSDEEIQAVKDLIRSKD